MTEVLESMNAAWSDPQAFLAEELPAYAAWQKRQALRLAEVRAVEDHALWQVRAAALLLADSTAMREKLEAERFPGLSGTESGEQGVVGSSGPPEPQRPSGRLLLDNLPPVEAWGSAFKPMPY